ncbi:Rad2 nuclease [Aphanomyces cochlioides]|nr:Rad2 nuclease [Aphanomyces cochlioides]
MFVQMCVLSGCDFLDSLPNIGPVTAQKHIFAFRGAPGHLRVKRILAKLRLDKVSVPADYFDQFCRAEALFYHHYVFNPQTQRTVFLVNDSDFAMISDIHALACSSDATAFLGRVLPPDEMLAVYQYQRRDGSVAKDAAAPVRALSHKEEEINEIHVVDLCTTTPSSPQVMAKMVTPVKRSISTPVNPKSAILGIVDQYRNSSASSGSQKRPRTDSPVQTNVEAKESKTSLLFRTTEATPTHHSNASSSKSAVLPSKKRTSPGAPKSTATT